mmetsp:Transcript_11893/g.21751  ORF Transcript_11893/g.21751 Transcript_11893/m.21751 type:complete len:353 (+) Transcript_11893:198-1256(+)
MQDERLCMDSSLEQTLLETEEEDTTVAEDARDVSEDHKLFWDIIKLGGIVAVALSILLVFRGSFMLPLVLATQGSILLLASVLASYHWGVGSGPPRPRLPLGALLLMSSSSALCSLLCVRMAASEHFGGDWREFDFGKRCHEEEECLDNRALDPSDPNTFGHVSWGMLAWLLFPAVERLMYKFHVALPGRVASVGLFFYPIYCWVKRNVKFRRDLFSTSSFVKSGAEWATGFCLAVALGLLCTAAEGGSGNARVRRHSCGPDRRTVRSTDGVQWIVWWCRLEGARQVASALLTACTIAAGIQIYATWHKPAPELHLGERFPNPPHQGPFLAAALLFFPCSIFSLVLYFGRET